MNTEKIKSIMKLFEESQISKMDLQDGDLKIILEKEIEPVRVVQQQEPVKEIVEESQINATAIKSPLVGTFYQASGQGKEPYVKVGDIVQEGTTLCIIEAMKVMNEIKAPISGKILSIDVQDGEVVEYDQTLMSIG